jgi:hypothetical protein
MKQETKKPKPMALKIQPVRRVRVSGGPGHPANCTCYLCTAGWGC